MNVVADALSRPPQINSMTATAHSDDTSSHHLIPIANEPINVFKNQIFLKLGQKQSYEFQIVFPTFHRHIIYETDYTEAKLIAILKKYLNPSVKNGLNTTEHILGKIQEIYPENFSNYRIRFARKIVKDVTDESDQEKEILNEHQRAHRNATENKIQLIERVYFPKMHAKIKKIVKQCKTCKEQKYDRHPSKPLLNETPIPEYPGQIVHLDIYLTNQNTVLTAIDKFSKNRPLEQIIKESPESTMAQNFDVSLLVQQMAALQATIENMRTEHQKQVQNLEDQIRQVQQVQIIPENQRVAIEPKIVNESQVKLDVFKSLPVFDGNINSYRIWREDVTRMMETISDLSGQPIYAQALQIVKTKIQGSAAQLLANHGTIFNFYAIRDRLDKAYADTRPLYVLQDEMKSCSQGRKPYQNFMMR
ncbi:Retrovirus-related Pol polyprotein from transposon opus [Eumeta japonica]|uniref:RNA-directed DNA polymerase n=1 Tax=Eumeta variegata TaxID=151549 RepID=A0A4C1SD42_EUMVA|nr:Retrovirus-related Pol polyprotein from transposon opus [Eumeta japonica]